MGTSLQMIDEHYGHLARDSEDSIQGASRRQIRIVWRLSGVGRRVTLNVTDGRDPAWGQGSRPKRAMGLEPTTLSLGS